MKNNIWNKRIPTILGLFLILIGIGLTTFLAQKGVNIIEFASPSDSPKDIRITNVSDTSFTVSFVTDADVLASLNFGKDKNLGQTVLDERNQNGSLSPHTVHSIMIKNLAPNTTYYFSIISGQDTFLQNGIPFTVKTGPTINTTSEASPLSGKKVSGKILLTNGSAPKEAIIYVTSENSQTLSSLIKEDGGYNVPLGLIRTDNLSSYADLQGKSIIKMLIASGDLSSVAQFSVSQLGASIPPIILSYNYDFTVSSAPVASTEASMISTFFTPSVPSITKTPQILIPEKLQSFTDSQPKFQGTALPNATIQITIHSLENIQATVLTDAFGNWSYRPTQPLSPGAHTISIIAKDASGIFRTISTSFVVFASGTQVTQSATPSATPTFALSLSPSPSPIITPTPTSAPTPTPTAVPTQQPIISLSLAPPIKPPPTGNSNIVTFGIIGGIIASLGIFIFLLTHTGLPL